MKCTIYVSDPSLLTSKLFERYLDDQVESYVGLESNGRSAGIEFRLDSGVVQMLFIEGEESEAHLSGLRALIETEVPKNRRTYALNRVANVRLVLGCVIEAQDEHVVHEFLTNFTMDVCGMALFSPRDLMDFDGEILTG